MNIEDIPNITQLVSEYKDLEETLNRASRRNHQAVEKACRSELENILTRIGKLVVNSVSGSVAHIELMRKLSELFNRYRIYEITSGEFVREMDRIVSTTATEELLSVPNEPRVLVVEAVAAALRSCQFDIENGCWEPDDDGSEKEAEELLEGIGRIIGRLVKHMALGENAFAYGLSRNHEPKNEHKGWEGDALDKIQEFGRMYK
tara:strand:+ start:103 stop:714 length:612 start_codon:yes stop_codon:yes gene_type:complete